MADLSTLARPYAKAVFEMAQSSNTLPVWSTMLETLGLVAANEQMDAFVSNPKFTDKQISDLFLEIAGSGINKDGKNLVLLLAENNRLQALPDIAARFEMLKAEAEGTVDVEITSVEPLSDAHKQSLGESLKRKLGRDVRMSFELDKSLLGGALIKAGDLVIDGTVRGRLQKLAGAMAD